MTCGRMLYLTGFCLAVFNMVSSASVLVVPQSAQLKPGAAVQFTATGSANGIVLWSLSGTGCIGISCGTITANGLYTAPAAAPSPATVTVTATSLADLTQSGTATVTIGTTPLVSVAISPTAATIVQSGTQQFSASVQGSSNTSVTWDVSGSGCSGASCGTVTGGGLYTAPPAIPGSGQVTVTATSGADSTKSASALVTIVSPSSVGVSVSPSTAQVTVGMQKQFTATVTGITNTAVAWTVTGTGCSGAACGSISPTGLYTGPSAVPSPPQVAITATSAAVPGRSSSATATIVAAATSLTISPSSAQLKPGAHLQFTASGPDSDIVSWSVTGSGCSGISCGSISSTGWYTAPAKPPVSGTVTVRATSIVNPSQTAFATVNVASSQVGIGITPDSLQLNVGASQQFAATVTGTSNTAVTWTVSGYGCTGSGCGTITSGGLYTAPAVQPSPSIVFITAASVADPTQSASATAIIATPIVVKVSPANATLATNGTQQFTATVSGTNFTSVTWTVSGTGCTGTACGTILPSGLYQAPSAAPMPATVTVTATSMANNQSLGSAVVTIIVPVSVTISPSTASVTVSQQLQFGAQVTGTSTTGVNWSVSGSGCSGSACGTISPSGIYTAPATVPSIPDVAVTATSMADSSAKAVATLTILPTNNAKFVGSYAYLFKGFDSNGVYQEAGSIQADGNGNIVSGSEDVNSTIGPATQLPVTGTYQVNGDGRGTLTLQDPFGTHTFTFALNRAGNKGRIISFDQSGVRGSGVILLQDPTAFDPSVIVGGYVLSLTGINVFGARIGALGLLFPDGTSFISGSSLDVNEGGFVDPTFASFPGTYTVDPSGRGTMTLAIPGFDGGTFDFAFYIVSANQFLLVSTDPLSFENPVFAGEADLQTGAPFTSASFSGGSTFEMAGQDGFTSEATVGLVNFGTNNKTTVNFDQDQGGEITIGGVMRGAYDVQFNGRGTFNLSTATGIQIWYMYAIAPNEAFLLDASTNDVAVGVMLPQSAPPFSNENIFGNYLFASDESLLQTTPLASGEMNFDGGSSVGGSGNVSGTEDTSRVSTLLPHQVVNGTYAVSGVSNNGRGTMLLTLPGKSTIAVWIVNQSEFFGLDVGTTNVQPAILHFSQ